MLDKATVRYFFSSYILSPLSFSSFHVGVYLWCTAPSFMSSVYASLHFLLLRSACFRKRVCFESLFLIATSSANSWMSCQNITLFHHLTHRPPATQVCQKRTSTLANWARELMWITSCCYLTKEHCFSNSSLWAGYLEIALWNKRSHFMGGIHKETL